MRPYKQEYIVKLEQYINSYQQKTGYRRGKNQFKNPSIAGKHPVKRNVFGLSDPLFALCRLFRFPKKQRTFECLGQKSKEINAPQRRDDTEFLHQNDGNRGQKSGGQLHHSNTGKSVGNFFRRAVFCQKAIPGIGIDLPAAAQCHGSCKPSEILCAGQKQH